MSDSERIASLMALANDDLQAARLLLASVPRQAAYHLQQAAEKIVKALLVREGVDPGRIHQVGRLARELPSTHPLQKPLLEIDRLTVYGTAMRYPQASGHVPKSPSASQLSKDLKTVSALFAAACRHLKLTDDHAR